MERGRVGRGGQGREGHLDRVGYRTSDWKGDCEEEDGERKVFHPFFFFFFFIAVMSFKLKHQETGRTCVALPRLPPPPAPLVVSLNTTYGAISAASVEKHLKKKKKTIMF